MSYLNLKNLKTLVMLLMVYGLFYQQMMIDDILGYSEVVFEALTGCIEIVAVIRGKGVI